MAFGWAGAAAGGEDALQRMLAERRAAFLQQQALEMRQAEERRQAEQFAQTMELQRKRFDADEVDRASDREYRAGQTARQARLDDVDAGERRQVENQRGVRRMIGDFLVQRGAQPLDGGARQTLQGMALQEGVPLPESVTQDPEAEFAERKRIEDLEHQHRLGEIAASGAQARATASVRTAGTRDTTTQRRIDNKAKGFDANPTVKRAQLLAEAASFAASLNPNTANPQDDQALIYNFAKSMDPDSAVREGEYATIQKYAQSLAERFGFNAARVFSNTTFLTPETRQNLKSTILSRFEATRGQYDALRKAYIDQLTQMGGDDSDLIDYGVGFPQAQAPNASTPQGPAVGTKRVINGVQAVWDGKGWKRAQ